MGEKGFLKLLYTKLRGKREVYGKDALSTSGGGPPPSYATAVGPPPPLPKRKGRFFFAKGGKRRISRIFRVRLLLSFSKRGFGKKRDGRSFFSNEAWDKKNFFLGPFGWKWRSEKKSFSLR